MADEWEVNEDGVKQNSTGVYYPLNVRTHGALRAPVTVKHSTRHNTMICLSCLTADSCQHARFVRAYLKERAA